MIPSPPVRMPATPDLISRPREEVRDHAFARPSIRSSVSEARHEWKYLLLPHVRGPFLADLRPFVQPDAHAGAEGWYNVRSLYLDSPQWRCFHDKVDGVPSRFKLRVRAYGVDAGQGSSVKFEIKYRDGALIRKEVADVDRTLHDGLIPFLSSSVFPHRGPLTGSNPLARFFAFKTQFGLRPVVNVEFRRRAFAVRGHEGCRVTLDEELFSAPARILFGQTPRTRSLPGGMSILEIKAQRSIPFWLDRLVCKYRLQRTPLSKYALAVAAGPFGLEIRL